MYVVISKLGRLENSLAVYLLKHFAGILNQELLELFLDFCAMPSLFMRACGHVDVETCPHQVLAAILTLFQPGTGGGGQIMPTIYCVPNKF